MQITEFDLKKIFESVWGYNAPHFLFGLQNRVERAIGYNRGEESANYEFDSKPGRREQNIKGSPFYALNPSGNEVFLPIWLIKPDNSKLMLQNTVSSFANKITIIETQMVNRKGSVKEEISINDWEINVKGIIVSKDYDYPDQEVYDLNQLKEMGVALGIENARSSLLLEANEMVIIKSLNFIELKGMKNIQPFELNLISDIPFELIIE